MAFHLQRSDPDDDSDVAVMFVVTIQQPNGGKPEYIETMVALSEVREYIETMVALSEVRVRVHRDDGRAVRVKGQSTSRRWSRCQR